MPKCGAFDTGNINNILDNGLNVTPSNRCKICIDRIERIAADVFFAVEIWSFRKKRRHMRKVTHELSNFYLGESTIILLPRLKRSLVPEDNIALEIDLAVFFDFRRTAPALGGISDIITWADGYPTRVGCSL